MHHVPNAVLRPSATETLFWTVASSAIPAGFGVGLLGGVIAGALVLSLISGRFAWQSFSRPNKRAATLAVRRLWAWTEP